MTWLMRNARSFGLARVLALMLLVALAALRAADPLPIQEIRVRVFDLFQVLHPREATQRPVVIIDIDEKSLKAIGQWPWPRTRVADLITRLTQMGALVIAFDIVFAEPDRMSPGVAADVFRDLDDATRTKLRALPSNDAVLADALRKSRVVLGESGLPFAVAQPEGARPPVGIATIGGDARPYLLNFPGLLSNVPVLEQAASGRGLFTIRAERDGIVRRVPIVMQAQGTIMPSLSLEMLRVVSGSTTVLIRSDDAGVQSAAVPGFVIPTDRNGQLWIHFAPHDASRYVSAADVLEGQVPADRVARRLVLIGTSAVGLLDSKTTPIDPVMPGVEVHAQVLESVLTQSVLSAPNYAVGVELCAALLLGAAIIWLAPILNPALLLMFGGALVALTVGASWYFYVQSRLLFDFTYPLMSSGLVYLTLVFSNYISEQAQRRRIRSAFGQYLSPDLVEQLAQSPEKLVLGGEEREMSILFSDVRGFTTISELYKDDPQGLTSLMNSFLTPLTNAVIEHKGTIDKYMGDAIMAFWNAPLHDAQHEVNACEAALEMLQRVETLNQQREQQAKETGHRFIPLRVGVGINTGKCVVGNMGSDLRFNYSVLGDPVNLASRLEGQSKNYGVPIIIGSKTAASLRDRFAVLELDCITVKGKTEPESVYTVLGRTDVAASERFEQLQRNVSEMLTRFRKRDFSGAASTIVRCRDVADGFGLDYLFDLYAERIKAFERDPPPVDWNGVFVLESK
ncbi:MAG TPA: adenylate/guanylate cyclase domain-containing protein [Pseudolabrys sp.]